jgi:radical SAM protein with 4Fe4S-binding SPASM domain
MIESKINFFNKKHNVIDNKKWLKNNLKMFEIEVFSYCNRKCWFCPNAYIDRKSETILMPEESYLSVMEQLREIDYDQEITYSRYNEPLAKKDIILKRIKQAREYLPKAKLRTNTNGDYLNLNYIHELRDAGLNQLFIQQYLGNNQLYNHNRLKKIMIKKIERLGVNYSIITDIFNHRIEFNLEIEGITVHLRARNFSIEGTARTKLVEEANKDYVRTQSCKQPFNNMYIDYNGSVVVCCNSRSDIPEHKNAIMGSIHEDKIWNIFSSERYDSWREHLKGDGPKSGICEKCKIDVNFEEFL